MKEQLIHILDQSVCLSRKQMKEYLSGAMLPEEVHAAEVHLNTCALCSMAMEGFEAHSEQALEAIAALNSGFLKDHFDNIAPQIHLNSIAHAAALPTSARKRSGMTTIWRTASLAAIALFAFGLLWAFERYRSSIPAVRPLAEKSNAGAVSRNGSKPENAAQKSMMPALPVVQAVSVHKASPPVSTAAPVAATSPSAAARKAPVGQPAKDAGNTPTNDANKQSVASIPKPSTPSDEDKEKAAAKDDAVPAATRRASADPLASKPVAKPKVEESNSDAQLQRGDESYGKGSYGAALEHYKKGMASTDEHTRYQSMIMAAQCYAALGNKAKAEELLQRVIDGGSGHERREAKHALRKIR